MLLFESIAPAFVGGVGGPAVISSVIIAAMVGMIGFVLFLALGLGTRPSQAERAEPTPTDDSRLGDTDGDGGSDAPSESGSD